MGIAFMSALISGFLFIGFGLSGANGVEEDSKEQKIFSILTAICAFVFVVSFFVLILMMIFKK